MSCPWPVAWSAFHIWLASARYIPGATDTVDPLTACGPRSSPKFGSFQTAQKLTRGSGVVCPGGTYVPL